MLDKLFHSKNRAGILALFLNNEDKKFYIQEVIKLTKGDPANTHRELINLQSLSILESENKGKQKYYFLNKKSVYFKGLKELFSHYESRSAREEWFVMEAVPSGMNPTLTYSYVNSAYLEKFFKELGIKKTPRKYLTIFNQDGYKLCFPKDNYKECSQEVLQMILSNPVQGIKLNDSLFKRSRTLIAFAEEARKINLHKLTDQQLVKLLEDFYDKQTLMHTEGWIGNIVDFVDGAFSNYLLKYLEKQIEATKAKFKKGEAFSLLTTPLEESFAQQEYLSYLKILAEIEKHKVVYGLFQQQDARFILDKLPDRFKKLIKQHVESFGWLGYGVNGPGWKEDYYFDLLASLARQKVKPALLIKKINLEKKETVKKQQAAIKALKIDQRHQLLFQAAAGQVFTKGYRKDALFHGFWCLEFLHREFAGRTNLALKQVRNIAPWEYGRVIKGKEKWSDELNKRWIYHIQYSEHGQHRVLSGHQAKQFVDRLTFEVKNLPRVIKKLEGECASPGKVRGVVVIINTPAENKKIEQGDILVSLSTNPDLMPAIRQAKAIVTDIGGLTSHASIISRELGIPCVVGTKIATQVLKDGSLVEVDATHGVVTIIKR